MVPLSPSIRAEMFPALLKNISQIMHLLNRCIFLFTPLDASLHFFCINETSPLSQLLPQIALYNNSSRSHPVFWNSPRISRKPYSSFSKYPHTVLVYLTGPQFCISDVKAFCRSVGLSVCVQIQLQRYFTVSLYCYDDCVSQEYNRSTLLLLLLPCVLQQQKAEAVGRR